MITRSAIHLLGCVIVVSFFTTYTASAQDATITIDAALVKNPVSRLIYGSNIEDVSHEMYGGFYHQLIFGESFEEPSSTVNFRQWHPRAGFWTAEQGGVTIIPGRHTTRVVEMNGAHELGVEPDQSAKLIYTPREINEGTVQADLLMPSPKAGTSAALLIRVSDAGIGDDAFNGYEIGLDSEGKRLVLGKHVYNFKLLREAAVNAQKGRWNMVKVDMKGNTFRIYLNGQFVFDYTDNDAPLLKGRIGLRTWQSPAAFRKVIAAGKELPLLVPQAQQVSYRWDAITKGTVNAGWATDSLNAYNGRFTQVIESTGGTGKAGIANSGLNRWGIALRKGEKYDGRLYLKSLKAGGKVMIALEDANGVTTYASRTLDNIPASWQHYAFSLIPEGNDTAARFAIYTEGKEKLWIDQVVLHRSDDFAGQSPVRKDIAKAIADEGVTFLRYAGTMVNASEYRFKKMIGDPDKRQPYKGHWNEYSTNGFGMEEFLQFCENRHITPCVAVNIHETPEDMADMIEYFNGDAGTTWGQIRAKNGHPAPYGIPYIEIGNEEVIFNGDSKEAYDLYIARFLLLFDAMHKKDPSVKFIHSAWWRPESTSMEKVFRALNGKAAYWDLHVGGDAPDAGTDTDKRITQMKAFFHQWDPQTTMKVAVFEENGSRHDMSRALGHATNMNAVRRHGDFVLTSSPANGLQPYLQNDNDWDQGQIFFTPDKVWGMPPFYAQQMQAGVHLPWRVADTATGNLDVTATRSENGDTLVLHVVNTEGKDKATLLQLKGFTGDTGKAEVFTLTGALTARNTPAQPAAYSTVRKEISLTADRPAYTFPAWSYTIMRFLKRK